MEAWPPSSSVTTPTQRQGPSGEPWSDWASKVVAKSGDAGSELGEGSLMNLRNGSPTNSAGVRTALRLCRYSGTRASTLRKNATCVAAALGLGPSAACRRAITCCRASSGQADDLAESSATAFDNV